MPALETSPEAALDARHPLHQAQTARGPCTWREAGPAGGDGHQAALVLLHGIGSGALAFAAQLDAFSATHRVLAWDAPGYGASTPLAKPDPLAIDYAGALDEWLQAARVERCTLLGHSLGALIAAAFVAEIAPRTGIAVDRLLLASPALGYGAAAPEVRQAKQRERVELIERLGPAGMAAARAAALCTPQAASTAPQAVALVEATMARVTPGGYAQAAHLLAYDELIVHARRVREGRTASGAGVPIDVICGELDRVTTAPATAAFAAGIGAPFHLLSGAAHACCVEHADLFNRTVSRILAVPRSARG